MENELTTMKLHILEILYSSIINRTMDRAIEYIIKHFLISDDYFSRFKSDYSLISHIISFALNSSLLFKYNCTIGEYVFNFIRIDGSSGNYITNNYRKTLAMIALNYLLPIFDIVIEKTFQWIKVNSAVEMKYRALQRYAKLAKIFGDLLVKMTYLFRRSFIYADVVDYFLKVMIVNKGLGISTSLGDKFLNIGQQLNLFVLFMAIRLGEWYVSTSSRDQEDKIVSIQPPVHKVPLSLCPICKVACREIKSPMATRCCGFVFCDSCLPRMINQAKGQCMMCHYKISSNFAIKMFI